MDLISTDPSLALAGCIGRLQGEGHSQAERVLEAADVVIDFTTGNASAALAQKCASRGGPALVIGSTGFEPDDLIRISKASSRVAIVRSGNFSLGVNMLMGLVAQIARAFPEHVWDIEVFEAHHRRKIDAPSGTALMLGEAAANGRQASLSSIERHTRDGNTGERVSGEIGFSVLRGGGIVGEHSVVFAADEEVLTLSHSALSRSMFARGAVTAARWVKGRAPGEYDMQDVLGLPK